MTKVNNLTHAFERFDELYSPKILANVNDTRIMLVKLDGDRVPWHTHDDEDELFIVHSGCIEVCFRNESHILMQNDMLKVPRGLEHKVIALEPSQVILVESKDFQHTGSVKSTITRQDFETLD